MYVMFEVGQVPPAAGDSHLWSVLRSRTILLRVALIAACFTCATFVLNGTIIYSTSISGSKYINFSAMLLVSVPTRIVTALTLTRFGRKAPICVAYTLCAVFFITSAFVPKCECAFMLVLVACGGRLARYYNVILVYRGNLCFDRAGVHFKKESWRESFIYLISNYFYLAEASMKTESVKLTNLQYLRIIANLAQNVAVMLFVFV